MEIRHDVMVGTDLFGILGIRLGGLPTRPPPRARRSRNRSRTGGEAEFDIEGPDLARAFTETRWRKEDAHEESVVRRVKEGVGEELRKNAALPVGGSARTRIRWCDCD